MKTPSAARNRGFTLVEILVVMAIIAVLAAAGFAAGRAAMEKARKTAALSSATALESAVNNFFTEYGTMPTDGEGEDITVQTDTDIEFLDVLLGKDTTINTRGVRFLTVREGKAKKNGIIYSADGTTVEGLFDPWGGPYHVMLDLDYDEQIRPEPAGGGGKILNGRRVAVWSNGADGTKGEGNAADDVTTW